MSRCAVCGQINTQEHLPCSLVGVTVSSGIPMGDQVSSLPVAGKSDVEIERLRRQLVLANRSMLREGNSG